MRIVNHELVVAGTSCRIRPRRAPRRCPSSRPSPLLGGAK